MNEFDYPVYYPEMDCYDEMLLIEDAISNRLSGVSSSLLPDTEGGANLSAGDMILIMCYISTYISIENLVRTYNIDENVLRVRLNRLEKGGFLSKKKLASYDGYSRTLYSLTKRGYERIARFLSSDYFPGYKGAHLSSKTIHDYYAGSNVQTMLRYFGCGEKMGMAFFRELAMVPRTKDLAGGEAVIRPDIICRTYYKGVYTLYMIEQDMCTEGRYILAEKVFNYAQNPILREFKGNAVIFSIHSSLSLKETIPGTRAYHVPSLKELLFHMKEHDFLETAAVRDDSYQEVICSLQKEVSKLHPNYAVEDISFSQESLYVYIRDILRHRNRYQEHSYYLYQYERMLNARDNVLDIMDGCVAEGASHRPAVFRFFCEGYQVFFESTLSLSALFNYLSPSISQIYHVGLAGLCHYFKEIQEVNSKDRVIYPLSKPLDRPPVSLLKDLGIGEVAPPLYLRNTYNMLSGDTVSFEYISHDIGGWYRSKAFYEYYVVPDAASSGDNSTFPSASPSSSNSGAVRKHHLIAVVDSYQDAYYFAKRYNIRNVGDVFEIHKNTLHFLLRSDLYRAWQQYRVEGSLLGVTGRLSLFAYGYPSLYDNITEITSE